MEIARTAHVFKVGAVAIVFAAVLTSGARPLSAAPGWAAKLDAPTSRRVALPGRSRVIVRLVNRTAAPPIAAQLRALGGRVTRELPIIDGVAVELPNALLSVVASSRLVDRISADRAVGGAMDRTSGTVGATFVRQQLGFDGAGVGVAIIDSGVNAAHDDLGGPEAGTSRVTRFVDLVGGGPQPYDDYGHGTHVAGIVAGSGFDSSGARTGIAPGAHLVVLKVLDANGRGRISDVIAALDYVVTNREALGVRVINLSVATGVYESYTSDPLTLAAKRAVSAGLVVVAAAGNAGRGAVGKPQYAGVTAPGNAPWVLTVGASSHMGTVTRDDDRLAAFSSRGPGAIDYGAKPDLLAPGVGIESITDPASTLYASAGTSLLPGTVATPYLPYMSLSGTSMSAPVVTGTVALMLQANPSLTPNAVKAILQYTAERHPNYDSLTQGAGFVNAKGAVELAAYLAAPETRAYPATAEWSARLLWGNHILQGGRLSADANAWAVDVTWGDSVTPQGARISWGVTCTSSSCDQVAPSLWQTACLDLLCTVAGVDPSVAPNVVWGGLCGGRDCGIPWSAGAVTATAEPEADIVVWGTIDTELDIVVWGTACPDPSCEPVVWRQE